MLTANKYNALSVIPRGNLISNLGVCGVYYDNAEDDPRLNAKTYAYDLQAVVRHPDVTCNERLSLMFYKKFILPSYTSKEILKYMYIHPLFLFKKTFWRML